jgi:hypothetical protein
VTERAREAVPARPPPTRPLEVGHPDSVLERAADRAAERVTGRAAGARRAGAPWPDGRGVPAQVHEVLRSPGSALDPARRTVFEPALGAGLSGVRLHDDAAAAASARAVGAAAYTVGSHVVFGTGRHAPGTPEGRALIAHELAHVLQRRDGLLQRLPDGPVVEEEVPAVQGGPLASAEAWVTRLREEFEGYGDDHVPQRYAAGRAWRIFELVSLPDLRRQAQAGTGLAQAAVDEAVAFAREQGATEHLAGMRIDIRENYTLFPETLARWYDEEAASLRAIIAFDPEPPDDDWKVELAKAGKREQFLFLSETYEGERIEAGLLEDVAADVLGGVFPEVSFEEHKRLLAEEARRLAREAGQAEYDAYVGLAQDPQGARAAAESEEAARALTKQAPTAGQELVAVELFAVQRRLEHGAEVMPPSVLEAWARAQEAILALNPIIRAGSMAPEQQAEAADAAEAFLTAFRAEVASYDVEQQIELTLEPPMAWTTNIYVSPEVAYFIPRLREARTPADWAWPVAVFGRVVEGLDDYIADRLTARGRASEAAELVGAGALTQELSALLDKAPEAKKVQAVFFPDAEELRNAGPPGAPEFSVTGFPLSWYVHRKDEVWYLTDLSNPAQPKVVSDAGGTADAPALALFEQLNTALRFPVGHLYWQLDGTPGDLATTAEWGATEWLTLFSALAGAAALAVAAAASFGATVPASVMILTGVGAAVLSGGAALADIAERSQAGVLTTQDVVVDTLALAGAFAGVGSMALGKVAASNAVKTAAGLTRVQALAEQAFVPVVLAGVGTDLASFAVLLGDAPAQLAAIDKITNDRDRNLARARLIGLMLLSGAMLLLSTRGVPRDAPRLFVDLGPDGSPVVRPFLADPELATAAAGLQRPDAVTAVVARADLTAETQRRVRGSVSHALTANIAPTRLEELVARMLAAGTEDAVLGVLGELDRRIWLGSVLGAGRADALEPGVVQLLSGAAPAQLGQLSAYAAQDAALTAKLLTESGPGVLAHLGSPNPVGTVQELQRALAPAPRRVPAAAPPGPPSGRPIVRTPPAATRPATAAPPVPAPAKAGIVTIPRGEALWADIPTDRTQVPSDFELSDPPLAVLADGSKAVKTGVTYRPTGATGYLSREYNPRTGELVLRYAFLDELPSWIQHGVPLVPGKGTPLQTYLTIRQMKLLGVGYGDVKSIKMSMIVNVEGLLEIHWMVKTGKAKNLEEAVLTADSFLYARTNAEQSGKQVVAARVTTGGDHMSVRDLMVTEEQLNPQGPKGKTRAAYHQELLVKYKASRNDIVYANFDIYLQLIDHPAR